MVDPWTFASAVASLAGAGAVAAAPPAASLRPVLRGSDFFKRTVAIAEKYKRPGQQLLHTMQTNGTKLDDEWAVAVRRHSIPDPGSGRDGEL